MSKKVAIAGKPSRVKQAATSGAAVDAWVAERQSRESEKMKRLTIDVSESLHRRIKSGCAQRGVKMADAIRGLLEAHFEETS